MDKPPANESLVQQLKPCLWDWVTLLLPSFALAPQLHIQSVFLWERQHLQFFPMAFGAAAWFFYSEGNRNAFATQSRKNLANLCSTIAILLSIVAIVFVSAWLSQVSFIALIWSWAVGRFANLTLLRITGICGLMAVTIPAPGGLDASLIASLQALSSEICSSLMDVTNILHVRRGNVLEIAAKTLFVEEACSGVDSQYALMAVAGVLLLIGRASLIVSLLTIVTVPIWAILGNLLRIYTIVVGLEFLGIDLSSGNVHTLLGLIVFVIAAWAHWSSVQFLNFLELKYVLGPNGNNENVISYPTQRNPSVWYATIAVTTMTIILSPLTWFALYKYYDKPVPRISTQAANRFPGKDDLPPVIGTQIQSGYYEQERETRNILGQHSHTWIYGGKLGKQIASLDMPFRGWHPLWECYMKSGWRRLDSVEIKSDHQGKPLPYGFYETVLENEEGEYAVLHFSLLDEDGEPFLYEGSFENTNIERNRWENTVFSIYSRDDRMREKVTFQFQLLTTLPELPAPDQLVGLRRTFIEMRNRIDPKSKAVIVSLKK